MGLEILGNNNLMWDRKCSFIETMLSHVDFSFDFEFFENKNIYDLF